MSIFFAPLRETESAKQNQEERGEKLKPLSGKPWSAKLSSSAPASAD
jgi:hypothetical protein